MPDHRDKLTYTQISRSIFFIILTIAVYLLNRFSIFAIDDYQYAFMQGDTSPISSLKDIIISQSYHYMDHSGRFIVHSIVQLFCGILGVEWFRVLNSIVFVIFCGLTTRLIFKTWNTDITNYIFTTLAIWLFIPQIGYTVLGNIACSVNYLWAGTATLAFLLIYEKIKAAIHIPAYYSIGLFAVGILCGSLQETFTIPIAGALCIYYCFNIKQLNRNTLWLLIGYCIGGLILVAAPGNFVRLQDSSSGNIIVNTILRCSDIFFSYWALIVAIFLHIVFLLYNRKITLQFIAENITYYLMIIISITFFSVVAFTGEHQLFYIGWVLIVLFIKSLQIAAKSYYFNKRLISLITLIIVIPTTYILAYRARQESFTQRELFIQNIKDANNGNVIVGDYYTYERSKNCFDKRYTFHTGLEPKKQYVSLYYAGDAEYIQNFIPCSAEALISILENHEPLSDNVWYLPEYSCYVIRTSKTISPTDVKIEAEWPLTGLSAIKNRLTNQIPSVKGILTTQQKENFITIGDYNYIFYYISLNGDVINIRLLE